MTVTDTIDRIVTHPLTVVSVILGLLGSLFQIPVISAVVATVWAQAGVVFGVASVTVSQGWLPPATGQAFLAVSGVLFLGRMLDKLWDGVQRRMDE